MQRLPFGTVLAILLLSCGPVEADMFDRLLDEAKQVTDRIVNDATGSTAEEEPVERPESAPPPPPQDAPPPPQSSQATAPSSQAKSTHDSMLVKDIQEALNQHGYKAGSPDGIYGPTTRRAIEAYQEDRGLTVDGVPTASLLRRLQDSVASGSSMPASAKVSDKSDSPATGATVKNAVVDGVRLGMPLDRALDNLAANGIEMQLGGNYKDAARGKISGKGVTDDGAGWIEVFLYQKDDVVYRYSKNVGYLLDRLPAGITVDDLVQKYREAFNSEFSDAAHQFLGPRGRKRHYDDESSAAWSYKTSTPHAIVLVNTPSGGRNLSGRFTAQLDMEWKSVADVKPY